MSNTYPKFRNRQVTHIIVMSWTYILAFYVVATPTCVYRIFIYNMLNKPFENMRSIALSRVAIIVSIVIAVVVVASLSFSFLILRGAGGALSVSSGVRV
ncbi:hypothetical protein HRbin02_00563 [Candidatus Calditenuaceae archaeon HR02]|nr:hypothetical protein HRbin02_00563 [Candidatus Calditenuaceae archaeon HR02]